MIKYSFILISLASFICACNNQPKSNTTVQETRPNDIKADEPIAPATLIVPGAGIGLIKISENADSVIKALGKPNKQDAAMGAQMLTWYAGHDTSVHATTVYAHRNFGAKDEQVSHVKQIRITSPAYQTSKWIKVGSPLDSILKNYQPKKNSRGLYDDVQKGIAFEIGVDSRCSAIIVHASGDSSGATLNMRP